MRSILRKWCNSLGILLPKSIADEAMVSEGSELEITVDQKGIHITPVQKKQYSNRELVKGYPKQGGGPEIDWCSKKGSEEW
jgi:antitoxin MazE